MQLLTPQGLATWLRRAADAHHEYEARLGKRDENWAEWYANFICNVKASSAEAQPKKLTPETLRERADKTEAYANELPLDRLSRDRVRVLRTEAWVLRGIAAEMEDA